MVSRCLCATLTSRALVKPQAGFHENRLAATEVCGPRKSVHTVVRPAQSVEELHSSAVLRAISFYAYPEERSFAGKLHQAIIIEEEHKLLREQYDRQLLNGDACLRTGTESAACLLALCPIEEAPSVHEELKVQENGCTRLAVVGTLDLCAARALPGEVLIGNSSSAAYLANVCTAPQARRCGVGGHLLASARHLALAWGMEALYVHIMAVNEAARRFYERHGFSVEQEESSNQAHYRGHCLDGVEGKGRTLLLRDTRLHSAC